LTFQTACFLGFIAIPITKQPPISAIQFGHAIWEEIKELDGGAFREVCYEIEAEEARQHETELSRHSAVEKKEL